MATGLIGSAAALPQLAIAAGWSWYVEGPMILVALVAGFVAGAWLPAVLAGVGVCAATASLVIANQLADDEYHWLDDTVFFLLVVGGPALVGALLAGRNHQVRRLETLQAELDEQQRVDVAAARLDEQSRVQQEVNAWMAERVAGIVLGAEGARRAHDAAALPVLEREARGVLDQLRDSLCSLSRPDPPTSTQVPLERCEPSPSRLDVVVAVALGVAIAVESTVVSAQRGPWWANALASLAVAAPLVWRRSHTIPAVSAALGAAALMSLWLTPLATLVTPVALLIVTFYSVGAWCRGHWWVLGWAVATMGNLSVYLASRVAEDLDEGAWVISIWMLGAVALGRVAAGRHDRVVRAEDVVRRLELGRGSAVRLAIAQERQALAGELHDSVAHAMTVVCLHAGAQSRAGGDVEAALGTIASASEQCLAELRDGLDAIEGSSAPLDRHRIGEMGRRMGVDLEVAVPTPLHGPAAGIVFRVVRESLVNVARHATGAATSVTATDEGGSLRVDVVNEPGSGGAPGGGSGAGLAGLADTVAAAGGRSDWGPSANGGFRSAPSSPRLAP